MHMILLYHMSDLSIGDVTHFTMLVLYVNHQGKTEFLLFSALFALFALFVLFVCE